MPVRACRRRTDGGPCRVQAGTRSSNRAEPPRRRAACSACFVGVRCGKRLAVMRGSDKHGPRLDEQLKHDANALVTGGPDEARTEGRLQEGLNEGDGSIGHRPELDDAPGQGLSETDIAERERLATAIGGARFPAARDDLVEAALESFATDELVERLRSLPPGGSYENVQEVWAALGNPVEGPHA